MSSPKKIAQVWSKQLHHDCRARRPLHWQETWGVARSAKHMTTPSTTTPTTCGQCSWIPTRAWSLKWNRYRGSGWIGVWFILRLQLSGQVYQLWWSPAISKPAPIRRRVFSTNSATFFEIFEKSIVVRFLQLQWRSSQRLLPSSKHSIQIWFATQHHAESMYWVSRSCRQRARFLAGKATPCFDHRLQYHSRHPKALLQLQIQVCLPWLPYST